MNCRLCDKDIQDRTHVVTLRICIPCNRKLNPQAFLSKVYDNMKSRCNNPKHPSYSKYKGKLKITRKQFYKWATSTKFYEYHDAWVKSGFDKKLTPSVDRVDTKGLYTCNNIQWLTVAEHREKTTLDQRLKHKGRYKKGREPGSGKHWLGW